ncbi:MAG: Rrf2 family transcriptional regulator [Armatimonadota bacterium]
MKLSTKARYALRSMIELALREGAGPQLLRDVAQAQRLSPKYLEQLTIPLRHAGLLRTERGPKGGCELARPATRITALDVVTAVEGPLHLLECVGDRNACDRTATCAARQLWMRAGEAISEVLAGTTLADLRESQRATGSAGAFCYEI